MLEALCFFPVLSRHVALDAGVSFQTCESNHRAPTKHLPPQPSSEWPLMGTHQSPARASNDRIYMRVDGNAGDSNRSVLPTSSSFSTGLANHIAVITILQGHKRFAWQSYCGLRFSACHSDGDCRSSTFGNIKLSDCFPILEIMPLRLESFGWCNSHEKFICPHAFHKMPSRTGFSWISKVEEAIFTHLQQLKACTKVRN